MHIKNKESESHWNVPSSHSIKPHFHHNLNNWEKLEGRETKLMNLYRNQIAEKKFLTK